MTPEPDLVRDGATSQWKRFYDECFSLHTGVSCAPDALVSGFVAEGVELILDARLDDRADANAIAAGCDEAGVYYVPAPQHAAGVDISDDAVTRYARLALRHKTSSLLTTTRRSCSASSRTSSRAKSFRSTTASTASPSSS